MSFEVFARPKPQGRPLGDPAVKVGPTGHVLHLNVKARQALGDPDRVLLLHEGKNIAFRSAQPEDPRSFVVIKGNVRCALFIREAGLTLGEKISLHLEGDLLRSEGRG